MVSFWGQTAILIVLQLSSTLALHVDDRQPKCVLFEHHYCNKFGYRYATLPSPTQHDIDPLSLGFISYEDEASKEFADFIPLLNSECSQKLGTLLCFLYFPFCLPHPDVVIYPCQSVCEEITHPNSSCSRELARLANVSSIKWPMQFDCSNYINAANGNPVYVEEEGKCANGTQPKWISTNPPTPTCSPCSKESSLSCSDCKIRSSVNQGTFKRNNYNFVMRATFNSFTTHHCKRALNFTLNEQYSLRSKENCTVAPVVLEVGSSFLALGDDNSCKDNCFTDVKLELEAGMEYVIAGHYENAADGCNEVYWNLLESNSLISKYNPRKNVLKFVRKGNLSRCGVI